jgi:hypothetical protein
MTLRTEKGHQGSDITANVQAYQAQDIKLLLLLLLASVVG